MKKIFLTITIVLIAGMIMFGQSIKVILPLNGSSYEKGKKMHIIWKCKGSMNQYVNVTLVNPAEDVVIYKIYEKISRHDYDQEWIIPPSIPPGYYKVRVATFDGHFSGASGVFSIRQVGPQGSLTLSPKRKDRTLAQTPYKVKKSKISYRFKPKIIPRIKIIQPAKKVLWKEGKSFFIEWKNTYTKNYSIKIDLYDSTGQRFLKNIKTATFRRSTNTSRFRWTIPKHTSGKINKMNTCRIKITRVNAPKIWGLSGVFRIGK